MRIGFLGLGDMGAPMTKNLIKGGHRPRVWNRSPAAARPFATEGAEVVETAAEAFDADIAFTMFADDEALRQVLLDSGLIGRLGAG